MSLRTTVLLLSTDEAHLLRHALPAAREQEGADVVVVDNASTDDTAAVAREHGARHVALERRLSYCAAMNAALAATGGDAVLMLNPDCFLEPGFLAAARPRLEEGGVGSVAPKLVRATGPEPDQRVDELDAAGMVVDRRRKNTLVGHGRPTEAHKTRAECFGVDGAAALYRREVVDVCALDGEVFDEDFERWASDVDLAWRARLLGWRCVYEPGAVARHIRYYSPTTRAEMPEGDRRMQFRNRYLMMAKNDRLADLAPDLHRILAYEVLALGHALVRERHLLGGYREAARLWRGARRRRAMVQARRRTGRPPFGLQPPA